MLEIENLASNLASRLLARQECLCVAESCTGGLISTLCTDKPGSSQWFERAFITYSNSAKHESIGVPLHLIDRYGAVSPEVATAMSAGALLQSHAHWSIAVTGIAGPTGGSIEKPIGLVWCSFAWRSSTLQTSEFFTYTERSYFSGSRHNIRQLTAQHVFNVIIKLMDEMSTTR